MLPLICLTASSCLHHPAAPQPPSPPIFQPIVEQQFCDENGQNCEIKSLCREYIEKDGNFRHIANHPLKKCHGIFGVEAGFVALIKKWVADLNAWLTSYCGNKNAEGN